MNFQSVAITPFKLGHLVHGDELCPECFLCHPLVRSDYYDRQDILQETTACPINKVSIICEHQYSCTHPMITGYRSGVRRYRNRPDRVPIK